MSTVQSKKQRQRQRPAPPSIQSAKSPWRRRALLIAVGSVVLTFLGIGLLERLGVIYPTGPWSFTRTDRDGYAERVTGVVQAVAIDNSSLCIKPDDGRQLCGVPRLGPSQSVPTQGSRVTAYYSFVPQEPSGDVRGVVWVAMYPA